MLGMLLKNGLLLILLNYEDHFMWIETCYRGGAFQPSKILYIPRLHDPSQLEYLY